MTLVRGLIGILGLLAIAWACSENRCAIPVRVVAAGVLLQIGLAILLLKVPLAVAAVSHLSDAIGALQRATEAGTTFVFGYLGGGPLPFTEPTPGASFVLAFRAFPVVLTLAALASLLLHWGILQRIVAAFAWMLRKTVGIGGALGIAAVTHIFVGHIEAPLLVRPWLRTMSRGELFALMSCGMAGVAGTVMVLYATLIATAVPDAFSNILVASILGTPAALAISAVMVPFEPKRGEAASIVVDTPPVGAIDAIVRGTMDGINVLAGLIALLIVAIALVTLFNGALGLLPTLGGAPLTLQRMFAWAFVPVLWLVGIPGADVPAASALMGTKTVINELVAYIDLGKLPAEALSPRGKLMMIYALCGFANFGSLGIMIGGMTAMAPERRADIVSLGPRTILSGTLATCMSAAVVGMLV